MIILGSLESTGKHWKAFLLVLIELFSL